MKDEVTLRQFRYFIAAATTGQFSAAAVAEHVSQSAITNAVRSLERQLRTPLFQRLPHGVALTPQGQVFFHHARHVMDAVSDAMNHANLQPQTMHGVIRVAATYTVLGYFLPDLLDRFKRTYPNIEIDLVDMERPLMEKALDDESIDLGIGLLSNVQDPERYGHRILVRSRRRVWTAANHALAAKTGVRLADVFRYPYILLTVDDAEDAARRHWGPDGQHLNVAMRTSSIEALRGLVAYGFGVSVLADLVYRPWSLEGKKIVAVPILDDIATMDVGLLWPAGRKMSGPAGLFRDFLIQACDGP